MIKNTKIVQDGWITYRMRRQTEAGQYGYDIHFTPEETERGREYVADRLRRARAALRQILAQRRAKFVPAGVTESEGGDHD